jgi:hypothetical protein
MNTTYDCLALFSSGLDSILAVKTIQAQGLRVLGLHFVSPFFGKPHKISHWEEVHGVDIIPVDISQDFVRMFVQGPRWGLGKILNPCVDCKILMLSRARDMLPLFKASFLISGEVAGQRPMSQRKDSLQTIKREAGVAEVLLRPLSALNLDPTPMEQSGLVDRSRLLGIRGRGRKAQMALAKEYGLEEIPTPGGGCLLTEPESARRFVPLLTHLQAPNVADFELSTVGRQLWWDRHWMIIGRNQKDNEQLLNLVQPHDLVFKLANLPGPIAVGRQFGEAWPSEVVRSAAHTLTQFSARARSAGSRVTVLVGCEGQARELSVDPSPWDESPWREPAWEELKELKKSL